MSETNTYKRGYILAALCGALAGGIVAMIATKAIPKMMAQMMGEMMTKMPQMMMARMKEEGFNPAELCQQMMARFNETPPSKETQRA